ncbi:MAG: ABC-F family ATP-binding cassette domain-containing protein [Myxococcota bacterium]
MVKPVLITCDRLSKAFGASPLFEELSFSVHEGDRLGLVGPNGAGKSTLLEIIAGRQEPDTGARTLRRQLRLGHVSQDPVFASDRSIEEILVAAAPSDAVEHERASAVERAISTGGFVERSAKADALSGGWRKRLAIVASLMRSPDVLLLDEPTNHLDVEGILWLERLLGKHSGAFITVSHDRYFLQNVTNRILEVNRVYSAGLLAVDGAYADFLEKRDAVLSQQAAYESTLANRARREIEWLRRGPKARTTKSKSRVEAAGELIDTLKKSKERSAGGTVGVDFSSTSRKTKRLWKGVGIEKSFGSRRVIGGLDLELVRGTRLGIVGSNGSGKTTLLRMIVGELKPDSGRIQSADGLRVVYFDQARENLDPSISLRKALAPEGDRVDYAGRSVHVASWARRFLFRSEQLETPVGRLSGGERARIHLARLMLQPADLLVLDEPTNDLDIPTLDVLEDSLMEFEGALILVTHDRYLLDRVCSQVLGLEPSSHALYAGYTQWLETRRASARSSNGSKAKPKDQHPKSGRQSGKKLSYMEKREWEGMEAKVLAAEEAVERAKASAEETAIASDGAALQERYQALAAAEGEVERLYARWAELEAKHLGQAG